VKLKLAVILSLLFLPIGIGEVSAAILSPTKVIVRPNVVVSATIGIPKMTLWGYGAPFSIIELSGVGVDQKIISKEDGYYSFDLVYLPDSNSFPELCVVEIDQQKRTTPPTCIPPITSGNYFYNVGPVILPPTISLSASKARVESQVSAEGKTIPNSNIKVVLGRPDTSKGILTFRLVKNVLAYYIPSYSIVSDLEGDFSFNMPTGSDTTWRVFAIAEYRDEGQSPKSNTLKFVSLTSAIYFWGKLMAFLLTFLTWPRIIILEILIIIIAIVVILISKRRRKHQKAS